MILKYTIMKRLTQLLASVLFIITVLTVYLAFDFTVNNIMPKKSLTAKHEHIHRVRKTSTISSLLKPKISSNDDNEQSQIFDQERRTRNVKSKQNHGKLAQFHKSKTGVKINQMKKSPKDQRKHFLTTKMIQWKEVAPKTTRPYV